MPGVSTHYSTVTRGVDLDQSARIIQKRTRTFLRQKRTSLPSELLPQYAAQCAKVDNANLFTRAKDGKTPVYFSKEMPSVILKHAGEKVQSRMLQMRLTRSHLEEIGSKCLIIPKAIPCGEFLIEERLPINSNNYHNMDLYLREPQLFDQAVREMTRLFSRVELTDMVCLKDFWGYIAPDGRHARYDNFPLYVVEKDGVKQGMVGLIDLEHLHPEPNPQESLERLARLFPLHVDIIRQEATALGMKYKRLDVNQEARYGKKILIEGYQKHLQWLETKGASPQAPLGVIELSPERVDSLKHELISYLSFLDIGIKNQELQKKYFDMGWGVREAPSRFLSSGVSTSLEKLVEEITPLILENINTAIVEKQLKHDASSPISEAQLVQLRSPVLNRDKLFKGLDEKLVNSGAIREAKHYGLKEQIVYKLMDELIKSGEIFAFDSAYYTGGFNNCWLRY